ncbi:TPA_asm: UL18 uORF [Human alphaherpesvirus 1]|nr:TPA_asm: UL18 uORF [Human alphaherpesvirus 1]
MLWGPCRLPTP